MKMRRIIVVLWLVLLVAAPVLAAEHGTAEDENKFSLFGKYPGEYIWALVWFFALLVVLWKFAWKPLLAGLTSRQEHIERQISDAENTRTEARKVLEEYSAKLADAERQGRDIISTRTKEAEKQAKDIAKQNQKDLEQMKTRASAELERERIEAEEQLWEQAGEIVCRLGEDVFGKSLNDTDNQKLIDEAIARLKNQQRE
jgi:F-type H+-transporting ATPase subunit b